MVCHILRGSRGAATQALVQRLRLPTTGAEAGVAYPNLLRHVLEIASYPPLALVDGYVRLAVRAASR